jgi:hypothetical protein
VTRHFLKVKERRLLRLTKVLWMTCRNLVSVAAGN